MTEAVQDVLVDQTGSVLVVTLNRPSKLNAISAGLSRGLGDALERAENDPGVNVVVLVGSGRGFCAGMDLVEFSSGRDFNHPDHPEWGIAGIAKHKISVPIIAAVHGVAAGGGFEIALACDLIVADDDAKIGLPEIKLGLFAAGGGLLRLPEQIPPKVANELALTGGFTTAADLARWGVINRVVPPGTARKAALELAQEIAQHAPFAIRATKRLLGLAPTSQHTDEEGWAENDSLMAGLFSTDDAREGVAAFQQKRRPQWTGR